jgi:DNA-binding NarL/FixJ family response regulator
VNGLEVCRRVKQVAPETQTIIVTAFDDTAVRAAAFQHGAKAFVPKYSLGFEILASTIQQLMDDRVAANR